MVGQYHSLKLVEEWKGRIAREEAGLGGVLAPVRQFCYGDSLLLLPH